MDIDKVFSYNTLYQQLTSTTTFGKSGWIIIV